MPLWRILIVEDDPSYRASLIRYLEKSFDVKAACSIKEAVGQIQTQSYDLALIDLNLPDGSGLDLLEKAQKLSPHMVTVVMTGYGDSNTVIQAIQRGAFHYLTKPFPLEELSHLVQKALKHSHLEKENYRYQRELRHKYQFDNIVGDSGPMAKVFELVEKISDTDSTILIRGESGTGKELIAKAIHYNSARSKKSLVAVNCGALSEELLESELFGHVKGAFTSAHSSRQGRFELADGGTIFLDEVGDMSPRLQVKLLRVLQEQKFEPVGSSKTMAVNVRVIAATHQDLEKAVTAKTFRQDLYYRLNVIPLVVPNLRQRVSDIPLLLNYFTEKINREKKKEINGFSQEAFRVLCDYAWPGNVRELENLVERCVILKGRGTIEAKDLPDKYLSLGRTENDSKNYLPVEGTDLNVMVDQLESDLIRQALMRTGGNRNKAARLLKIKRTTLVEKIKRKKLLSA
jgi:DNA-binding NtrC family response regulator